MKIYRAAVVGCGKIGSEFAEDPLIKDIYTHAGAYSAYDNTELIAICDIDINKVRKCAERWDVKHSYTNFEKMLSEQKPEIISVCTPDQTHYEIIRTAILSPSIRAIMAEKPLAINIDDANELVKLAEMNSVLLAVNYSRRYAEGFKKIRNFINNGGIGKIQVINGYYVNGILHSGTHWFDLIIYLFGDVKRVKGIDILNEGGNDPTIDVYLELSDNIKAYLHGCDGRAFTIFELDIIGTLGRIRVCDSGHDIVFFEVSNSPHYSNYNILCEVYKYTGGMNNMLLYGIEDLVTSLDNNTQPLCSGKDGIKSLKIATKALISVQKGEVLNLEE